MIDDKELRKMLDKEYLRGFEEGSKKIVERYKMDMDVMGRNGNGLGDKITLKEAKNNIDIQHRIVKGKQEDILRVREKKGKYNNFPKLEANKNYSWESPEVIARRKERGIIPGSGDVCPICGQYIEKISNPEDADIYGCPNIRNHHKY